MDPKQFLKYYSGVFDFLVSLSQKGRHREAPGKTTEEEEIEKELGKLALS